MRPGSAAAAAAEGSLRADQIRFGSFSTSPAPRSVCCRCCSENISPSCKPGPRRNRAAGAPRGPGGGPAGGQRCREAGGRGGHGAEANAPPTWHRGEDLAPCSVAVRLLRCPRPRCPSPKWLQNGPGPGVGEHPARSSPCWRPWARGAPAAPRDVPHSSALLGHRSCCCCCPWHGWHCWHAHPPAGTRCSLLQPLSFPFVPCLG